MTEKSNINTDIYVEKFESLKLLNTKEEEQKAAPMDADLRTEPKPGKVEETSASKSTF